MATGTVADAAKANAGTKTGDQLDSIAAIQSVIDLFKSTPGTSTTTTETHPDAVAAATESARAILAGTNGLAATAQGGKAAGLYNSTSSKLLQGNVVARAAGQGALINNQSNGTKTVTTQGSKPAASKTQAAALLVGQQLLKSKAGQKLLETAGNAVGGAADSAASAIGSYFSPAVDATNAVDLGGGAVSDSFLSDPLGGGGFDLGSIGNLVDWSSAASPAIDMATSAATDAATSTATDYFTDEAVNKLVDSGASEIGSLFGFAAGGRVPKRKEVGTGGSSGIFAGTGANKDSNGLYSVGQIDPATGTFVEAAALPQSQPDPSSSSGSDGDVQGDYNPGDPAIAGIFGNLGATAVGVGLTALAGPYANLGYSLTGAKGGVAQMITDALLLDDPSKLAYMQEYAARGNPQAIQDLANRTQAKESLDALLAEDPSLATLSPGAVSGGSAGDGNQAGTDFGGTNGSAGTAGDTGGNSTDAGSMSDGSTSFAAKGGKIKGDNNKGVDDVKTMLDGGEFVVNARAVDRIDQLFGPQFLEKLNAMAGGK